jgi:uncharacterized LabA/DUF88 family protein
MSLIKKIIAIDGQNAERAARNFGFPYFPLQEFLQYMKYASDVIETLYTVQKRVPENDTAEAIATVSAQIDNKCHALEMIGAKAIICPAKRVQDGSFKQSDDQLLQIKTLSICMRLKPDFLTLVSGDDDHAPLIWELREHGIRTEVIAPEDMLGSQLRRACYAKEDLNQVFRKIQQGY